MIFAALSKKKMGDENMDFILLQNATYILKNAS